MKKTSTISIAVVASALFGAWHYFGGGDDEMQDFGVGIAPSEIPAQKSGSALRDNDFAKLRTFPTGVKSPEGDGAKAAGEAPKLSGVKPKEKPNSTDFAYGFPYEIQQWSREREGATSVNLREEKAEIDSTINELTQPIYLARFDSNDYEIIRSMSASAGVSIPINNGLLESYRIGPRGETYRVVLPESDFPDLYRMRRLSNWLSKSAKTMPR